LSNLDQVVEGRGEALVLKLSRFAHGFRGKKTKVIYNSLTNRIVLYNLAMERALSSENRDAAYKLAPRERNLLLKEGYLIENDDKNLKRAQRTISLSPSLYNALFLLTDECNFRCKYCYIETPSFLKQKHSGAMTVDTAKKACDLFLENYDMRKKDGIVTFYGGEPLMNKKTALSAFDYIADNENRLRKDQKVKQNIVTNGSLIDDAVIKKIIDYDIRTSVSMDGPRKIHDLMRVYPSGKGTYEDVIRNYRKLKKAGVRHVAVSITIGKHNINHLEDFCEFVATKLEPVGVKFNFMSPINSKVNPYACDIRKNLDKILASFEVLRDYGVFEDTIGRKLEHFVKEEVIYDTTTSNGAQVTLFPNGSIGPSEGLWEKKFTIGLDNLANFENTKLFKEWKEITPVNKLKCAGCPAIGLCGGGRPSDSYVRSGNIFKEDEQCCTYMPGVLEWLVWSYAKRSGLV